MSGEASRFFEPTEKASHFVAVSVEVLIVVALVQPVGLRWDDGLHLLLGKRIEHGVGVVRFVGNYRAGRLGQRNE